MAARIARIVSLLLLLAIFAGIIVGSKYTQLWYPETTGPTGTTVPASSTSTPVTVPPTTKPIPEATVPPTPQPLPPGSEYTVQAPTVQKPAKPSIALPKLSARDFFIYDTRLGDFLYISCKSSKAVYPASTTKLFTAYVALQYLSPAEIVTVGSELSYVASDASIAGFRKGDQVSVEALVYASLLPSGCDASYILAAAAGRVILNDPGAKAKTAINAFMDECNRFGLELGMENTNLVTPDGYHHANHKISIQAFAIIGQCCLENELIAQATAAAEATITYTTSSGAQKTMQLQNTNQTIHADSKFYHALSVGLKTGFTGYAGYCLLTAYRINGRHILVGVFGSQTANSRFQDANKLLNAYLPYL